METPTALPRAAFRRRLLIVLLLILLVLLLAFGFSGDGSGQVPEVPPGQPMPSPSFSPTYTPLPPDLFTVVVTYTTRTVFIETHTFFPTGTPTGTPTDTPTPGYTQTHTPNPATCQGHGRDLGVNWLVAGCDNLSYISRRTGIPLADLLAANPWIANPDLIYPGQLIQLPGQR